MPRSCPRISSDVYTVKPPTSSIYVILIFRFQDV